LMNQAAAIVQSTDNEAATVPKTLAELFTTSAERYRREDALNYKRDGEWQKISSANFLDRSRNIALGLAFLGLRKGAALTPNLSQYERVKDRLDRKRIDGRGRRAHADLKDQAACSE